MSNTNGDFSIHFIRIVPSADILSKYKILIDPERLSTTPHSMEGNISFNTEWESIFSELTKNPPYLQVLKDLQDDDLHLLPNAIDQIKIVIYKSEFGFDRFMAWMEPDTPSERFMEDADQAEILHEFTASIDDQLKPMIHLVLNKVLI